MVYYIYSCVHIQLYVVLNLVQLCVYIHGLDHDNSDCDSGIIPESRCSFVDLDRLISSVNTVNLSEHSW